MGSISRYNALERHLKEHEETYYAKYEPILVGRIIKTLDDIAVDYHVKGTVCLDDNSYYETHYRWTSEDEDIERMEIPEENELTMKQFYEQNILGKTIKSVSIGFDRDDMIYCYAFITNPPNISYCLEIPIIDVDEIYEIEDHSL